MIFFPGFLSLPPCSSWEVSQCDWVRVYLWALRESSEDCVESCKGCRGRVGSFPPCCVEALCLFVSPSCVVLCDCHDSRDWPVCEPDVCCDLPEPVKGRRPPPFPSPGSRVRCHFYGPCVFKSLVILYGSCRADVVCRLFSSCQCSKLGISDKTPSVFLFGNSG